MLTVDKTIRIYEQLAGHYERQGEGPMRDRFLVLAADAALTAGRGEEAERLRGELLRQNPHHLLRPFASLPEALQSPDVQSYLNGLRRSYPPDRAEQLLESVRAEAAPIPLVVSPPAPARPAPPVAPPAPEAPGVLKVYQLRDDEQGARESAGRKKPAAGKRSSPTLAGAMDFAIHPGGGEDRDPPTVSWWVATLLFWLILLLGLGLAIYTLGRPFLPF